ncbi:protein DOG1-like 4 [Euphorbia lathyris]|uniref:protein DOG1-like 4 n=1 Tax=Euphorbia lathyris TaxID=212925 RepID=UPI003313D7AC
MKSKVEEKFTEFFEKWISQLEDYLQQLRKLSTEHRASKNTPTEQELQALVSKVTQHYKEYYTVKWALAVEDVLPFFYPIWSTPLENAYSWVTGWKPSAVFKLLDSVRTTSPVLGPSLVELTQEQQRKIQQLRAKVRVEKEKVEMEMERQQVAVAERKMVELARLVFRVKTGDKASQVEGLVQVALNGVLSGLVKVMKMADCVRLRTMKGTLDILNPLQCVDFLAMITMFQLQLQQAGKKMDCIRHVNI